MKNTGLGLLVGLLLGLVIAFGGVLLDNTVHNQEDIEQNLQLAFLGVLPKIRQSTEGDGDSVDRDRYILENPKSAVAECARSIRTNLIFMGTERPLRRLLFTSARPAEGKTTSAIAMGITMAQAGSRVLLIDTDLRKPRLHKTFGVSAEVGLTSTLVEIEKLDEAIKSTQVVGLDVLPCGPLPPNPAELLHSERFVALLDTLSKRYDRLLLDSPPVGAVTDAAILSQTCDGTLLVVQSSKSPKETVRRAARQIQGVGANLVGVILNDFDIEAGSYGYHHYHYYRYSYGVDEKEVEA
jgi:capsular exopolysaccharide synthesis family protein